MGRRVLIVFVALSALYAYADKGTGKRWWSYVQYLASDKLEGRGTGTEGHRLAVQFVVDHFKQDGLVPAGTQGYFQPVKFYSCTVDEKGSNLALVRNGRSEPLRLGEDAIIRAAVPPAASLRTPLAFVGFGLSIPELKYDDLAGQDLHGKVVVYITGGPSSIPGPLRSHAQSAGERWHWLHRAGAIGIISIYNPHQMDIPWPRAMVLRFLPTLRLADPAMDQMTGDQLGIGFNPAEAEKLFVGSGHTFAELIETAQRGEQLPRFPLAVALEEHAKYMQKEVISDNVVGIRPGSDPALKDEYVIVSAHVDHLGVGEPIGGDRIYNGAMDNAAGVATVLDVADALHESGVKTRRSLLFLVVTGEEAGLLGSRYYSAYPTVPLPKIIADVNIDMFLPIFPLKELNARGLEESSLGPLLKKVAAEEGVETLPDPAPERNAFIRSDQYSFIKVGIPSIFFSLGYTKGTPEEAAVKQWITNRYHSPSDDIEQPVDLAAAAQYDEIVRRLAQAIANDNQRPKWNADSFFRRYAK